MFFLLICWIFPVFQALLEAQEQFKANLSTAESDFSQLAALDKKIKSFNIGPNPYTWYTVCINRLMHCKSACFTIFAE